MSEILATLLPVFIKISLFAYNFHSAEYFYPHSQRVFCRNKYVTVTVWLHWSSNLCIRIFFYGTALIPTLLSFKKGCKSLNILNFCWLSLKLQSVLKKKRKKGSSWMSSQHFMFARSEQTVGELWLWSLGVTLTFSPFLLRNTSTVRRSSIDTILSSLTVSSNLKCRK